MEEKADVSHGITEEVYRILAARVIEWLRCSMLLMAASNHKEGAKAYSVVWARNADVTSKHLMDRCEDISKDTVRRFRVRFDVVMMHLVRVWIAGFQLAAANYYLYADGSPHWRGVELFAAVCDMFVGKGADGQFYKRLTLPLISIARCMYSAHGKCFALLWQICLIAAQTFQTMLNFCNRVRGITTDRGAERFIPSMPDILAIIFVWFRVCTF